MFIHDFFHIFVEVIENDRLRGPPVRDRFAALGAGQVIFDGTIGHDWGLVVDDSEATL
jgi:hypothetical protein